MIIYYNYIIPQTGLSHSNTCRSQEKTRGIQVGYETVYRAAMQKHYNNQNTQKTLHQTDAQNNHCVMKCGSTHCCQKNVHDLTGDGDITT